MNKKKSLEKLEDGKEEDGEKNTKELDDFKGEKEKRMRRSTREEIKSATKQICSLSVVFGLYTIWSSYHCIDVKYLETQRKGSFSIYFFCPTL